MHDDLRPPDYVAYRQAASVALGRSSGADALSAFGLSELFASAEAPGDLSPVYAFLEAQGAAGALTPALGLLGAAGCGLPAGRPVVLGSALGGRPLVGVPGMPAGAVVAFDRPGAGLVTLVDLPAAVVAQPPPIADAYVTVLDPGRGDTTVLVPDEAMADRRAGMLARTRLGAAAELVGVVDRLLADALSYARARTQFGRPVTGFQSMQHLLAWAATERHQLVSLFDVAVTASTSGSLDPALARAVKALAGRVLHAVTQAAVQVTGAIGFTWEYPLNRFHRRGLVLDQLAGASADLVLEMGREVRTDGVLPDLLDLEELTRPG